MACDLQTLQLSTGIRPSQGLESVFPEKAWTLLYRYRRRLRRLELGRYPHVSLCVRILPGNQQLVGTRLRNATHRTDLCYRSGLSGKLRPGQTRPKDRSRVASASWVMWLARLWSYFT